MKFSKIHLFLILLLALLFCGCLGTFMREGMASQTSYTGAGGNTVTKTTGPQGNTAYTGPQGYTAVDDNTNTYSSNSASQTSYTGAGGNTVTKTTGPQGNTAYTGPQGYTAVDDNTNNYSSNSASATTYTGPQGNQATVATGPAGQTVVATSNNTVNGIPYSEIPPGQSDLYILKSEVVPPVCPACPPASACPRQTPCQPCPPCARCPEPAFDCKKVPNYASSNDNFLPRPVLSDFSQFGM